MDMDTKAFNTSFGAVKTIGPIGGTNNLNGNFLGCAGPVVDNSTTGSDNDPIDDYYYSIINQKLNELTLENEPNDDEDEKATGTDVAASLNITNGTNDVNGNSAIQQQQQPRHLSSSSGEDIFNNGTLPQPSQHFQPSLLGWNVEHLHNQLRSKLATIKQGQARFQAAYGESQQQLQVAMTTIQRLLAQVQQELADQLEVGISHQMLELNQVQSQVTEAIKCLQTVGKPGVESEDADAANVITSEAINFAKVVLDTPVPSILFEPPRLPPLDHAKVERALRSFFTRQPNFVPQSPATGQQQISPSNSDHDSFIANNIDNFAINNFRQSSNNWSGSTPVKTAVTNASSHLQQKQQHYSLHNGHNSNNIFMSTFDESDLNMNNFFGANNVRHFNGSNSSSNNSSNISTTAKSSVLPMSKSLPIKVRRERMTYNLKFGEQGMADGQFAEPSGVAVNKLTGEIVIADANNHRVQVFDKTGKFKFHFGDGKLKFPNRVAISNNTGEYVVSERPPVHQIQVFTRTGQLVCKFGAKHLKHPRGLTVDHRNRIVVVECKVMRVFVFNLRGDLLHSFDCSQEIQFPNAVAVSRRDEIYISDNRSHCVKVFNFQGDVLRQIGGAGVTNYPIGVCLNEAQGLLWVIDNYNNLNVTIFRTDGQLIAAYESSLKHQQCLDVSMRDESSIVVTSKDLQVYIYTLNLDTQQLQQPLQQQQVFNTFVSPPLIKPIGYNNGTVAGHKMAASATTRHHSGGTANL